MLEVIIHAGAITTQSHVQRYGCACRLGPVPIASHQVVSQLWLLSSLLIDSVAIAGQALVAVELGRGDVRAARDVSNRLLQVRLVPMCAPL